MLVIVAAPTGQQLSIEAKGSDSVESFRFKVQEKFEPAHPALQSLFFEGQKLQDGSRLSDYNIKMESLLTLGLRPEAQELVVCVGGVECTTTLETLTSNPGTAICSMFENVRQGGAPCYPPAGDAGDTGPDGVMEGIPCPPTGPLPRHPNGAYVIDRDGTVFKYILNNLRGMPATEVALSAAKSSADLWLLAAEARYYGLDELAAACTAGAGHPKGICSLFTLAAVCGVRTADIVSLAKPMLTELLEQQGVNLALAIRIQVEIERERARLKAEEEAERIRIAALAEEERALETLRTGLARMDVNLSEAGLRTLVAGGLALQAVCALDVAAALEHGLSQDDASQVGPLGPVAFISKNALI
eukprot:COSAG02_NODE_5487_length_4287_cov_40.035112_1_plen_358_part_10